MAGAIRPARVVIRKEIGAAVNEAVGARQADVETELRDLRRVIEDDLDATNETTVVFGRLLSQLADRLDDIEARLGMVVTRLEEMNEATRVPRPGKAAAARQAPAAATKAPTQGKRASPGRAGSGG